MSLLLTSNEPSPVNWDLWEPTERAVLVYLIKGEKVLLIHKRRGLGKGKINAPGGKLEPGETYEQAALRECREETGIRPEQLIEAATHEFAFSDGYGLKAKTFFAYGSLGFDFTTEEAFPFWNSQTQWPWSQMWADDELWLDRVARGEYAIGRFYFHEDQMIWHKIQFCPSVFWLTAENDGL
jgi:8-oxo-dGTP diphosphatase